MGLKIQGDIGELVIEFDTSDVHWKENETPEEKAARKELEKPPTIDLAEILGEHPLIKRLVIKNIGEVKGLELIATLRQLEVLQLSSIQRNYREVPLDLEFLRELPQLQELHLASLYVCSIEPISALLQLRKVSLDCVGSEAQDEPLPVTRRQRIWRWLVSFLPFGFYLLRPMPKHWYCKQISLQIFAGCEELRELELIHLEIEGSEVLGSLPKLERLKISSCKALDFAETLELARLKGADFNNTNFSSLRWLASSVELIWLKFRFCEVQGEPLCHAHLPRLSSKLQYFEAEHGHRIGSLEFLSACWELRQLIIAHNGVRKLDIAALAELRNLRDITLISTDLRDLTPLAYHRKLNRLWLGGCYNLSDISPLAGLAELEWLGLNSTLVSDLAPLQECWALEHLEVEWACVTDFLPLYNLPNLQSIRVEGHPEFGDFQKFLAGLCEEDSGVDDQKEEKSAAS